MIDSTNPVDDEAVETVKAEEGEVSGAPVEVEMTRLEAAPTEETAANLGEDVEAEEAMVAMRSVSWFTQTMALSKKNVHGLWRRKWSTLIMIVAPTIFVLVTYGISAGTGGNIDPDSLLTLNQCGAPAQVGTMQWTSQIYVNNTYVDNPFGTYTYNEPFTMITGFWQGGGAVTVLVLGPFVVAVIIVVSVAGEASSELLGVLRSLGMYETAYWSSWMLVYLPVILLNSLIAAGITMAVPDYVMQSSYYGAVFATYFFFQLALIPFSFFTAALCGSYSKIVGYVCFVLACAMFGVIFGLSIGGNNLFYSSYSPTPQNGGGSWVFSSTTGCGNFETVYLNYLTGEPCTPDFETWWCVSVGQNCTTGCSNPVVATSYDQFNLQVSSASDFYSGCLIGSSGFDYWWGGFPAQKFALVVFFFWPWYHFARLWGMIMGAASLPGTSFTSDMLGQTSFELAQATLSKFLAIGNYLEENQFQNGTLFPAGSVISAASVPYSYNTPVTNNCPTLDLQPNQCSSGYAGNTCPFLNIEEPANDAPSFGATLGILVSLAVIFFFATVWFAQIVTMGNGVSQPLWFFLLPDYWCPGKARKKREEESRTKKPDMKSSMYLALKKSHANNSLQVYRMNKYFDSFQAVKDVSFELAHGEVCVLLGHNGAGKSTLIKMLTGQISPSAGSAFVYGHSVVDDVDAVRRLMGVCPQDDMLFPTLTAKQHLELYAIMRGVPKDQLDATVVEWLKDVNLLHVANAPASTFSGGMKRRLSVALSTIGNTRFVVLDEPTTGMDPVNRRFVWQHIEKIKKGRMIILCTHNMDEADIVGENVIIMAGGEVVAKGSPLELKRQFGTAMQFNLQVAEDKADSIVEHLRTKLFENVPQDLIDIENSGAGAISVKLQRLDSSEELGPFLDWLQDPANDVIEYGITNSSLDEVFMKVTDGFHRSKPEEEDPLNGISVCCECCCTCCIRCCMCCCCPKPILKDEDDPFKDETQQVALEHGLSERELKANNFKQMATFTPKLWWLPQLHALMIKRFSRQWTGRGSIALWIFYPLFIVTGLIIYFVAGNFYASNTMIGFLGCTVLISLTLPALVAPITEERSEGLVYIMQTQGLLGRAFLLSEVLYSWLIQFIYTFLFLTIMQATFYFQANLCGPDNYKNCAATSQITVDGQTLLYTVTPGDYGQILAICFAFSCTVPGSVLLWSIIFPGQKSASAVTAIYALGAGVAPVMFYFLKYSNSPYQLDECQALNVACQNSNSAQCLAFASSDKSMLCAPSVAALFPQFGLALMLGTYFNSDISFYTMPPSSVGCDGEVCDNTLARERFNTYFGYTLLGALILLILGVVFCGLVLFTPAWVQHQVVRIKHFFKCTRLTSSLRPGSKANNSSKSSGVEPEDEDVTAEKKKVQELIAPVLSANKDFTPGDVERDSLPPVLVDGLSKVYPSVGGLPPKVALVDFSLHVPAGQVLGLLGANGAGKTTMLRILAGFHQSTTGVALVSGYDIATERLSVFERLGNCPQFDVVYKDMSVKRHLEFFARLKGLPNNQVGAVAQAMAAAVGLGSQQAYRTLAGELSGGMRRRLSLAIALLASPRVVILDEPSTGLDPSTRHKIWDLVEIFAAGDRSMIITTHSMEEADTLSDRIAIMVNGQLRVIGSSQRLKNRFGSGFLLQVNLLKRTDQTEKDALEYIRETIHPGAEIRARQAKTIRINLPNDESLSLKAVFDALLHEDAGTKAHISQWLVSQASLEDVFVNICESGELQLGA